MESPFAFLCFLMWEDHYNIPVSGAHLTLPLASKSALANDPFCLTENVFCNCSRETNKREIK